MCPEKKETHVDDLSPGNPNVESVLFRDNDGDPLSGKSYELTASGSTASGETDPDGKVLDLNLKRDGLKVKLALDGEGVKDESAYPDNPGPLDPLELREKRDGGKGMIVHGDSRSDLVKHLQRMLKTLGFDLGSEGPDGDGVTGAYKGKTEDAVNSFQTSGATGFDDKPLSKDKKVGPKTADALNRALVGRWYSKYKTAEELTPKRIMITAISTELRDGLAVE